MFLGVGGDVGLARLAAIETLSAYRARNHDELRIVAACQVMVLTRPRRITAAARAKATTASGHDETSAHDETSSFKEARPTVAA